MDGIPQNSSLILLQSQNSSLILLQSHLVQ